MEELKCGGIEKFIVIKKDDLNGSLSMLEKKQLTCILSNIFDWRLRTNKKPDNEYIVINTDEPYVNEIIEILKKNNQWG